MLRLPDGRPSCALVILLFVLAAPPSLFAQNETSRPSRNDTGASVGPDEAFRGFQYLDTEHFRIVYERRDEEAARAIERFADDVYEIVTTFLENRPRARIHVLLNGRTDLANGYFTPLPRHHIAVFVAPPTYPLLGARTQSWLYGVFVHELVHYVHFMHSRGAFDALSRVFGEPVQAAPGVFLPGWAIEGIAVFAETHLTAGGRGRNPYFEHYYIAPILDGTMHSYSRAGFDSYAPPRGRFYVAGYLFIEYLLQEYGTDFFAALYREYLSSAVPSIDRALERLTGRSPEELWAGVIQRLERRYAARRSLPDGERITADAIADYHSIATTGGELFAYRTRPDRPAAIVRVDPRTGSESEIIRTVLFDPYSFDVGGDGRIVYSRMTTDASLPGPERRHAELMIHTAGASRSLGAAVHHPALLPDGSVVGIERVGRFHRLVHVDAVSGDRTVLYDPPQRRLYWPTVSRDGRFIAFTENHFGDQTVKVASLSAEGHSFLSDPESLPVEGIDRHEPEYRARFQADGSLLVVKENRGILSLFHLPGPSQPWPSDTSDPPATLLTDRVGVVDAVQLNRSIYYVAYRSTGYTIRRVSTDDLPAGESPPDSVSGGHFAAGRPETPLGDVGAYLGASAPSETQDSGRFADRGVATVWFPFPGLLGSSVGSLRLGLGAAILGGNLSGTRDFSLVTAFFPGPGQVAADVSFRRRIGRFDTAIQLSSDYTPYTPGDSDALQESLAGLSVSVPLVLRTRGGRSQWVELGQSVAYRAAYTAADSDFAWFLPPPSTSVDTRLELGTGLRAVRSGPHSRRDLYPSRRGFAGIAAAHDLSSVGSPRPGVRLRLEADLSAPVAPAGHSLFAGFRSSLWTEGVPRTLPVAPTAFPPVPNSQRHHGAILGRAGYRGTVALLDRPLPFGFNIQGLAVQLSIEHLSSFDRSAGDFTPGSQLYLGAELLALAGYSIGTARIRGGVNVRILDDLPLHGELYISL